MSPISTSQQALTAITGGIGSGKSYICRLLAQRGIDVYDCDAAAKRLMLTSGPLKRQLQELVGKDVYDAKGQLQKDVLRRYLLTDERHKQAVNEVVHPAVAADFLQSGHTWLESAILFDSGFYQRLPLTHVVCVAAPLETRIARVMARDGISREKALQWIGSQWPQDEVMARSQYVIVNDEGSPLEEQIENIINEMRG